MFADTQQELQYTTEELVVISKTLTYTKENLEQTETVSCVIIVLLV